MSKDTCSKVYGLLSLHNHTYVPRRNQNRRKKNLKAALAMTHAFFFSFCHSLSTKFLGTTYLKRNLSSPQHKRKNEDSSGAILDLSSID